MWASRSPRPRPQWSLPSPPAWPASSVCPWSSGKAGRAPAGAGRGWVGPGPRTPMLAPQGRPLFPGHVVQRLQVHGPVQPDPVHLCADPLHGECLLGPWPRGEESAGSSSWQVLVVGVAADPAPAAWLGHCGSQQRGLSEMVKVLSPWCTVGPQKPEQLSWARVSPPSPGSIHLLGDRGRAQAGVKEAVASLPRSDLSPRALTRTSVVPPASCQRALPPLSGSTR